MRCPHCSLEIPIGQQFCGNCGKRVDVGFDDIRESVLSDAADRRSGILEKVLLNLIGALIVIWVAVALLNDHYRESIFPGARSASICMPAPPPSAQTDNRLVPKIDAPSIPMPRVPRRAAQAVSWRREPFKAKMCEAACSRDQQEQVKRMVAKGLAYLASRQGGDGGWYISREGGSKLNDWGRAGITGLALLSFLGDGHTWVAIGENSKGEP
ncbi:MAG: zinc ribbon domain-containing protein, partial [Planctomycetota bacterium]